MIPGTTKAATAERKSPSGVLDQLFFRRPVRVHVREFSVIMAIVALLVGAWFLYRHEAWLTFSYWLTAAVALLVLGRLAPLVLYPFWKLWMGLAHVLGTVVTFVLLFLVWTFITIPCGFLAKAAGKRLLDLRWRDESVSSYWDERDPAANNIKFLERQY